MVTRGKTGGMTPSIIKGGYIVLSASGMQTRHAVVSSADEASTVWRKFIEDSGLGASDLKRDSGFIYSNDRKLVAKVSYNGRVWSPDGELLQERPMSTCEPGDFVKVEFPDEATGVGARPVPQGWRLCRSFLRSSL
jgi:hypothetical protein